MTYTPRIRTEFHRRMNAKLPRRIRDGEPPDRPETFNGSHKLTDRQAAELRRLYANSTLSQREIASRYSLSRSTVSRLVRGDTYQHAGGPTTVSPTGNGSHRRLNGDTVAAIRRAYADGATQATLSEEYGPSQGSISDIVRGHTYPSAGGPISC